MTLEDIGTQLPEGVGVSKDDEELFKFIESSKPRIYVVGTGGSGCNTMNRMADVGIEGATLIAMNTDVQHLVKVRAQRKLLLGKKVTKGLGAGGDPQVGEQAAKESAEEIRKVFEGASMVFIACGLGGGTGTGSASVIAEQAKGAGALTIAVVTLPFASEGKVRLQNALSGLDKLKKCADTTIVIPNDKLLTIAPDLPLNTAFKVSDEVIAGAVKGITELVTKVGLINLDFADLRAVLVGSGCGVVSMGEASLEARADQRALIAVETALNSPLLDVDISTADKALVNVIGGEDMTLKEAELVVSEVSKRINPLSHIIWGARVEKEAQKSAIRVLVVLAGTTLPNYGIERKKEEVVFDLDLIS